MSRAEGLSRRRRTLLAQKFMAALRYVCFMTCALAACARAHAQDVAPANTAYEQLPMTWDAQPLPAVESLPAPSASAPTLTAPLAAETTPLAQPTRPPRVTLAPA